MTKKKLNEWIMYHEIHRLNRLGFTQARIARYLVLDPRTVSKYLKMSEYDMEQYLVKTSQKKKILDPFEGFVKERLSTYHDTSSAQIHDWLKESFNYLPSVSTKTVYNFVAHIRQKYGIPYMPPSRDYFPVEETAYGDQSQVDFGQYNMNLSNGKKKKVYFFAMVLSRSRMKFIWFQDKAFTSETVVQAHEKAFEFFGGIPKTLVYDQDRTIVVDENLGDILLTTVFNQYTKTRNFGLHFCRKSDPESKGKVENVIQYVKKNFLYNRPYYDLETLNEQALAWLQRTANHLPHNYTKKRPMDEFMIEQNYLTVFVPFKTNPEKQTKEYHVRKNNVINYKSNFYTLPQGTYKGPQTKVLIRVEEQTIYIFDESGNQVCSHKVSPEKGKTISNTHHRRDNSLKLEALLEHLANHFTEKEKAKAYLFEIKKQWPRYSRDHFLAIKKALDHTNGNLADKTLEFCLENHLLHGSEFEQVMFVLMDDFNKSTMPETQIRPMGKAGKNLDNITPQTSNIDDYENIIDKF